MELYAALGALVLAYGAACVAAGRFWAQRDLARLKEKLQQKAVEAALQPPLRGTDLSDALGLPDEADMLPRDE